MLIWEWGTNMNTLTKTELDVVYLERKAALIQKECGEKNIFSDIIPMIKQLRSYERKLQRLAEIECNGYPKQVTEFRDGKMYRYNVTDEALELECVKKEEKLRDKVLRLATEFNLTVKFQGDPRGFMFALETDSGVEITLG